jgi:acetylornithine deacetylase/succinyl-diaminopimelate desuccinylase-like protein
MQPAAEPKRVVDAVNRKRLLDMAWKLIEVPSRTGEAGKCLDCLAGILEKEGFKVERPAGGHPKAPAVIARYSAKKPGRTLQFNGHLDTVHLPFVPPRFEGDLLRGSGSSDMKAGTTAAVEAMLALRDADALPAGSILMTANDLHETPWGDGSQLNNLIKEGYVGDAVLIPEYLNHCIPMIGRGGFTWKIVIRRPGAPIHEVMRPNEPNVIAVAAELVNRIYRADAEAGKKRDPQAGPESFFIGQIHAGEIFNQYPQECRLEGTRRWLPGTRREDVESQFRSLVADLARETQTTIDLQVNLMRDSFVLEDGPFLHTFQKIYRDLQGKPLEFGAKPFCDDGNSFWQLAKVPCITHGPNAGGAHTLEEWVSCDDLVRVAKLYALTAVAYCPG